MGRAGSCIGRALAGCALLSAVWMMPEPAHAGQGDGGLVGALGEGLAGAVSNPQTSPEPASLTGTVKHTVDTLDPGGTVGTVATAVGGAVSGVVDHATSQLAAHPGAAPDADPKPGGGSGTSSGSTPATAPGRTDSVTPVRHVAQQPPTAAAHDSSSPRSHTRAVRRTARTSSPRAPRRGPTYPLRAGGTAASPALGTEAAGSQPTEATITGTSASAAPDPCWVPGLPPADRRSCLQGHGLPNLGGPDLILLPIGLALIGAGLSVVHRRRAQA